MVFVTLHGRLGNYLFEIAAAATLAAHNNDKFCAVCHDKYNVENQSIWNYIQRYRNTILKNVTILKTMPEDAYEYKPSTFKYKPIPYRENILLNGGFQSYKYFDEAIVKDIFRIPSEMETFIREKYSYIFSCPVVGIHVRRGDYCHIPHKLPVCSKSYIKKAMGYFPKDTRFVFFSDDIKWCKNNFKSDRYYFFESNDAIIDLYAQALCSDNIISNSTFSWWGAYLNSNKNKKVICPTPWFGKFAQNKESDVEDLIPKEWIQIPNHMDFRMWIRAKKMEFLTIIGKV